MNIVHTIVPGASIPYGYFDDDNVTFIQTKISEVLAREFQQTILIDKASIVRTMQFVLAERRENVPKSNRRVIMYICNDFRNHQYDVNRALKWEAGYISSQRLVDKVGGVSRFDQRAIKTTDQKKFDGKTKVGGTLRFYFT